MADNFISGVQGSFLVDDIAMNFKNWKFPIDGGTRKFFAFGSGFQRTLPGGISAEITAEGAYNQGNMPLALGALGDLVLGWDDNVNLTVTARLSNIEYSNEIGQGGEPGGQCKVTFASDGEFEITFT